MENKTEILENGTEVTMLKNDSDFFKRGDILYINGHMKGRDDIDYYGLRRKDKFSAFFGIFYSNVWFEINHQQRLNLKYRKDK